MDEKKILEEFKKKVEDSARVGEHPLEKETQTGQPEKDKEKETGYELADTPKKEEKEESSPSNLERTILTLQAENEMLKAQLEEINKKMETLSRQTAQRANPSLGEPSQKDPSEAAEKKQDLTSEQLLRFAQQEQEKIQEDSESSASKSQGKGFFSQPGVMFLLGKVLDNFGPAVVEAIKKGGGGTVPVNSGKSSGDNVMPAIMNQLTAWGQMMGGLQTLVTNMQSNAITGAFQIFKDLPVETKLALLGIEKVPKFQSVSAPRLQTPRKTGYIKG